MIKIMYFLRSFTLFLLARKCGFNNHLQHWFQSGWKCLQPILSHCVALSLWHHDTCCIECTCLQCFIANIMRWHNQNWIRNRPFVIAAINVNITYLIHSTWNEQNHTNMVVMFTGNQLRLQVPYSSTQAISNFLWFSGIMTAQERTLYFFSYIS